MWDRDQLPYLVRLLDDDSPEVREQIERELLRLGPDLEDELRRCESMLTPRERAAVRSLLWTHRTESRLREAWRAWPALPTDHQKLEAALESISHLQYGWVPPVRLADLLDDLASGFLCCGLPHDAGGLSRYLFTRRLRGNSEEYYNPFNSNIIHVIQSGKGLPITLACVFILVGRRVRIEVCGCSMPGHFLAGAELRGRFVLFDCFNRGRILSNSEVEERKACLPEPLQHRASEPASAESIVIRMLHNIANAYELAENPARSQYFRELLEDLRKTINPAIDRS